MSLRQKTEATEIFSHLNRTRFLWHLTISIILLAYLILSFIFLNVFHVSSPSLSLCDLVLSLSLSLFLPVLLADKKLQIPLLYIAFRQLHNPYFLSGGLELF